MNFTTLILNVLCLSVAISTSPKLQTTNDSLDLKFKNSHYVKQATDSVKLNKSKFHVVIKGAEDYDIVLTKVRKETYEAAKQIKTTQVLDKTIKPSQINFTEDCYTVSTGVKTVQNCLSDDEQLHGLSYLGFIKKLNSVVVTEDWFESTTSNLLINLGDGARSYISGDTLIFSPNLKFIYSYAHDGIDFDGMSLHYIKDKKAELILVTDYDMQDKYKVDFSALGDVYWDSDTSFLANTDNDYYRFKIQDKRVTYRNERKATIIHSENKKFIIKVDQLKDGTLRYMSWNKPNSTKDKPDLVLYNGEKYEQHKYGSGFDYRFENGPYLYIIEDNEETTSAKRLMLRLYKANEEILYTSLLNLKELNKAK
ncbi:hypothetical protein [Winogradskyella arenosi]|uniref:Uncharacterized protein n=1 Tax=Winogradskyella arenosi TaxID=533325 RepID=A0A368ZCM0_9FLAO|nr:hypothetical protein [Winogradskyella arenosi]RCW90791.1 hypothetical protein DFQ08_104190 [Winogradskyella arenosi]